MVKLIIYFYQEGGFNGNEYTASAMLALFLSMRVSSIQPLL